jgi:peptidoglycan/LPS O-acetylase OafA/YrhL
LDGLRGIAILLVLTNHFGIPGLTAGGPAGVAVFFTLSGFLITSMLLEERASDGRISLGDFYRRRALRLFPALAVVVLVVLGFGAVGVGGGVHDALPVAAYVANWARVTGADLGLLNVSWSLAVEEQFYVAWPLILIGLLHAGRRRVLVWVTVGGIAYSLVARFALWDSGAGEHRVYFGSDTQASGLLIGCLLAIALRDRQVRPEPLPLVAATGTALVLASGFARGGLQMWVTVPAVVPFFTAAVIYGVVAAERSGGAWLEHPALVLVGRRSYGLYLWHPFAALILVGVLDQYLPRALGVTAALAAAWLLTLASWRYVEEPLLRKRSRVPAGDREVIGDQQATSGRPRRPRGRTVGTSPTAA